MVLNIDTKPYTSMSDMLLVRCIYVSFAEDYSYTALNGKAKDNEHTLLNRYWLITVGATIKDKKQD